MTFPGSLKRWILPLILALASITALTFDLHQAISFEQIQAQRDTLKDFANDHYIAVYIGFIAVYALSVALSLPIALILSLLAGFLFGLIAGVFATVSAATLGATAVFLIARSSLGASLREKAGPLYQKISSDMTQNAVSYLLFLRLVPLFPFFLVNIAPALFNISTRVFVLTTFIGILPGSAVFVYAGQQLGEIEQTSDLIGPEMLLAFGLLGLMALIPVIYKKVRGATGAGNAA